MCERARSVAVFRVNPIDDGGQLQQATEPKFVRSFWKVTLCVESLKGFAPLSLFLSFSICPSLNRSRFGIKGSWNDSARRIESQSVVDSKEFGWTRVQALFWPKLVGLVTFARLGSNGGVCAFVVRVVFNRREFSFFLFFFSLLIRVTREADRYTEWF